MLLSQSISTYQQTLLFNKVPVYFVTTCFSFLRTFAFDSESRSYQTNYFTRAASSGRCTAAAPAAFLHSELQATATSRQSSDGFVPDAETCYLDARRLCSSTFRLASRSPSHAQDSMIASASFHGVFGCAAPPAIRGCAAWKRSRKS